MSPLRLWWRQRRFPVADTVRVYPDQFLVTVLAVDSEPGEEGTRPGAMRFSAIELDVIVGRNFLVSAHKRPLPFAEELDARTATNPELGRFDASYLLHVMLDTLLDDYADEFERLEDRVGRLEEELLRESGRGSLDDALALKRQVHKVRRIVAPHRAALSDAAAAAKLRTAVRQGTLCADAVEAVLAVAGQPSRTGGGERLAGLTPREIEVLRLIAGGATAKEAARQLDIAPKTADNHIQSLYSKIGVTTRAAAALYALERGLVQH